MPRTTIPRDPIAAQARRSAAQRRVGIGAQCGCGESRPDTLIRRGDDVTCDACIRRRKAKTVLDNHHVAGKANSPATIPVPVNDHRARLSADQYDWPKQTRENLDRSPLLAAAGCIRGFVDTVIYLVERILLWIAAMLEALNEHLINQWGPKWWLDTPLGIFVPGVSDAKN